MIGIGISFEDYENFKSLNIFHGKIYINEGKSIYDRLKLKRNGCCNCFGISCKLNRLGKIAKEKNLKNNFKGDLKQNGGELILRKDGTLIKLYVQKDPSDFLQLDDLRLCLQLASQSDHNFSNENVPLDSHKFKKK